MRFAPHPEHLRSPEKVFLLPLLLQRFTPLPEFLDAFENLARDNRFVLVFKDKTFALGGLLAFLGTEHP